MIYTSTEAGKLLDNQGYLWSFNIHYATKKLTIIEQFRSNLIISMCGTHRNTYCNTENEILIFSNYNSSIPKNLKSNVAFLSCGDGHLIILCEDHTIWGKGNNNKGQLGLGKKIKSCSELSKIKTSDIIYFISCGADHSLFLSYSNKVYVCGCNRYNQLGVGAQVQNSFELMLNSKLFLISFILGVARNSYCVDIQGNLFAFGILFGELPRIVENSPKVNFISSNGNLHTKLIIQDTNGDIWKFEELKFKKLNAGNNLCGFSDFNLKPIFQKVCENRAKYVSENLFI